jgi:O-methyltransferase
MPDMSMPARSQESFHGVDGDATMSALAERYLDLMKHCLTRSHFDAAYRRYRELQRPDGRIRRLVYPLVHKVLARRNLALVRPVPFDAAKRADGQEWPPPREAETMIGLRGLDNIQHCIADVLRRSVPGDLIETGVWRGGAVIFMRAVLEAYGDRARLVWAADSFRGLPRPDADRYPADAGDRHWAMSDLVSGLDEVKQNFARYGLLDDRVRFLEGWFRDTLPQAPIEALALLRLDGDMYESTMDGLTHLYPKLSPGGYVIVDDYGGVPGCRAAVDDYRTRHHITEPMHKANWEAVYWQKRGDETLRRWASRGSENSTHAA